MRRPEEIFGLQMSQIDGLFGPLEIRNLSSNIARQS